MRIDRAECKRARPTVLQKPDEAPRLKVFSCNDGAECGATASAAANASSAAAEWMYWTWCNRAASLTISDPVLRQWVDLHATEKFADQARWLRQQIDLCGAEFGARSRSQLSGVFRRAIELEIDFHTAPYRCEAT